ncbi:MAG: hypothetical protein NXI31_01540 [bacterium]|nr:hypothetical protein [bacterium]
MANATEFGGPLPMVVEAAPGALHRAARIGTFAPPRHYFKESQAVPLVIIGVVVFAFGVIDLVGSFAGLDVWGEWIQVDLPEAIWSFTAYIELGLGALLFKVGMNMRQPKNESA